jgi:hypothetical protein
MSRQLVLALKAGVTRTRRVGHSVERLPLNGSIALVASCVLSGCAAVVPLTNPPSNADGVQMRLEQEMVEAVALDPGVIVIGEDAYEALLEHRGEPSPLSVRHRAAALAANLADPTALGVIATLERRPAHIHSNLFIVLRDPVVTEDGKLQGRDAFVAAVELRGPVPWLGGSPRLALLSRVQCGDECRKVTRGCQPIFGTLSRGAVPFRFSSSRPEAGGLPPTVLLNLESGARPLNGSGRRPRLLVFGANRGEPPSAYECHSPVAWDDSSREPRKADGDIMKPARTATLPKNAILLGERDFLAALSLSEPLPAAGHDAQATRQLLALANSDEALGISARYEEGKTFSGELFAVARDPVLTPDGRVMATEYYLAPVRLSGKATWLGTLPEIAFNGEIPEVFGGFCGLVSTPTEIRLCDRPPCEPVIVSLDGTIQGQDGERPPPGGAPGRYTVEGGEPRFGADRWPARSRVTLRLATFEAGRKGALDLNAIACSDHRPPFQITPNADGPGGCGNREVEICNGVDDDCDGDIDEGDVCANRDTHCIRTPTTCADLGATCGVVNNGCNIFSSCGPPCR